MSSANLTANVNSKKSKAYKKYAGLVDDRKSKLARDFHHDIFPLKPEIFEGDLAQVIKDFSAEVLAALIADQNPDKWTVLQFCILLWSDSMGPKDTKLDEIIKLTIAAKPEDGMPILALAMFSSGTFKSFDLNIDQQILFTTAALSLIVATIPYLFYEIQSIRRHELWAHGGQVFTLALGDRFLPSHFCWTRCRNLFQVLLDAVLKYYIPDLIHQLGYPYSASKSTTPDPRIMEALATPYLNLITQQPLPLWVSILKFKLNQIPHDINPNCYKLVWHSAVGMICQVSLQSTLNMDLKLNKSDPTWAFQVLLKWQSDPTFKLFWHQQNDLDLQILNSVLLNVRADTIVQPAIQRLIQFVKMLVDKYPTQIDLIIPSTHHLFLSVLGSINNTISQIEKQALQDSFTLYLVLLYQSQQPQQHLAKLNLNTLYIDYLIESWSIVEMNHYIREPLPTPVQAYYQSIPLNTIQFKHAPHPLFIQHFKSIINTTTSTNIYNNTLVNIIFHHYLVGWYSNTIDFKFISLIPIEFTQNSLVVLDALYQLNKLPNHPQLEALYGNGTTELIDQCVLNRMHLKQQINRLKLIINDTVAMDNIQLTSECIYTTAIIIIQQQNYLEYATMFDVVLMNPNYTVVVLDVLLNMVMHHINIQSNLNTLLMIMTNKQIRVVEQCMLLLIEYINVFNMDQLVIVNAIYNLSGDKEWMDLRDMGLQMLNSHVFYKQMVVSGYCLTSGQLPVAPVAGVPVTPVVNSNNILMNISPNEIQIKNGMGSMTVKVMDQTNQVNKIKLESISWSARPAMTIKRFKRLENELVIDALTRYLIFI